MGTAADQEEEEEKKLGTGIWDEASSGRINYGVRRRGAPEDELIIEQRALAMALHHQQKAQMRKLQRSLSQQEFRSNSNASPLIPSTRIQDRELVSIDEGELSCGNNGSNFEFKRSSSDRPRRGNDAVLKPQELLNGTNGTKAIKLSDLSLSLSLSSSLATCRSLQLSKESNMNSCCSRVFKLRINVGFQFCLQKGVVHLMAVGVDSLETKDIVLGDGGLVLV
jgi:hypothetical protein